MHRRWHQGSNAIRPCIYRLPAAVCTLTLRCLQTTRSECRDHFAERSKTAVVQPHSEVGTMTNFATSHLHARRDASKKRNNLITDIRDTRHPVTTHLLTHHALAHSPRTYSLTTRLLTHTHLLAHTLLLAASHQPTHTFIHLLTCLLTPTYTPVHPPTHPLTHSL